MDDFRDTTIRLEIIDLGMPPFQPPCFILCPADWNCRSLVKLHNITFFPWEYQLDYHRTCDNMCKSVDIFASMSRFAPHFAENHFVGLRMMQGIPYREGFHDMPCTSWESTSIRFERSLLYVNTCLWDPPQTHSKLESEWFDCTDRYVGHMG